MSIDSKAKNSQESFQESNTVLNEFKQGWRVLLAAFFGVGVSLVAIPFYSAGIWVIPWQESFGWTRAEIGGGGFVMTMTLILTLPIAGKLLDRFSMRLVVTLSLLLYAIGLFSVSQMNGNIWVYYTLVAGYTIAGVAATPLAFTRAINGWFDVNRGLALGITLTSTGVAAVLLPKLLIPYVDEHGWRAGFVILAGIVVLVTPIVWFWLKENKPNKENKVESSDKVSSQELSGLTLSEAIKTKIFWKLITIFTAIALAVCGLIPNFIPLLQGEGLSATEAGKYGALLGFSIMVGRLVTGFLIDRFFAPYVTATIFIIVATGCLSLALGGVSQAYFAAITIGFAIGSEVDLIAYYTSRYFGMRNYGVVYAFQYSSFSGACGISTVLIGYLWDITGSYDIALICAVILLTIASILSLTLPHFPTFKTQTIK